MLTQYSRLAILGALLAIALFAVAAIVSFNGNTDGWVFALLGVVVVQLVTMLRSDIAANESSKTSDKMGKQ